MRARRTAGTAARARGRVADSVRGAARRRAGCRSTGGARDGAEKWLRCLRQSGGAARREKVVLPRFPRAIAQRRTRHCERSEAIQLAGHAAALLRRGAGHRAGHSGPDPLAPRNDGKRVSTPDRGPGLAFSGSCFKHASMHHFAYRGGVLHAEDVDLIALADAVGTPFYCYTTATLERHYRVFAQAFADVDALICYAMKANSNQAVIATLARLGAGADVVSEGELLRARSAGVPAQKIMFSGVGKTARELALAVEANILCVNVESEPELELLAGIAAAKGRAAAISIRVNPDIDPKTLAKISTGKAENKFGIPISRAREVYARAAKLKGVRIAGVDMHIGSQIIELDPFADAFALLAEVVTVLRADGHTIAHIDLGGGLGIP